MKFFQTISLLVLLCFIRGASGAEFKDCYQIENIKLPAGVPPEVGAIDFAPDGSLFVVLRRGDVLRAQPSKNPAAFQWSLFASGFHNGCGIDALSKSKIRVIQMADMLEVEDDDGDGKADSFMRFASGWGLSGNYHETNSLTRDGKGGYFLAIGTASHNGPVFRRVLGSYAAAGRRGRNFAAVKWRGWVLHVAADGQLTPWASGFRMHNGIYQDADGHLWSGDNQGDWKAATPLYHIEKGNFYGHPSSLVWDPAWEDKDPLAYFRDHMEEYNQLRTRPAVELPHQQINRSAGEPHELPRDGSFGPFAGQLLVPDNNGTRISRVMLEKVQGKFQGAVTHFIDGQGLRSGNHRLRFSPDGKQLYIGQTVRGWGKPAEGLQRVTWLGGVPFDIATMKITKKGFVMDFTKDIPEAASEPKNWKFSSFILQPTWQYGSREADTRSHAIIKVTKTSARGVEVELEDFTANRIYQLDLAEMKSAEDDSLMQNRSFYYTANALP
jgi:glucose/arabinose dehydrogenase